MSASGALRTESTTDIISYFALLAAAVGIAMFAEIIGASGGDITFMPGTDMSLSLTPYPLILIVGGVVVGYTYNGQELDQLEVADGMLALIGIAAPLAWFYVPQVQDLVPPEWEVWARLGAALLGLAGVYILSFGDEGGILG